MQTPNLPPPPPPQYTPTMQTFIPHPNVADLGSTNGDTADNIILIDPGYAFSEKLVRHGFIRKVYGILMCQLLVTLAFISIFAFHAPTKLFILQHFWISLVAYIFLMIVYIFLICCHQLRRTWPWNLVFLSIFTLAMSLFLGFITCTYDVKEVFMAVGYTTVICFAITVFAFQTKWDFTMYGGFLYVFFIILLLSCIVAIFVQIEWLNLVLCGLGTLLFSCYLVYDTQLLIGGTHSLAISPEEYIFAALMLYVDIIQILRFVLRLMR